MAKYALAFDFGATSIRAILGGVENGRFVTEEVMRMKHSRVTSGGRSRWEWEKILNKVTETILANQDKISSVAVNTWGVDFGLVGKDGEIVCSPVSYRDSRHAEGFEYAKTKMSEKEIFSATGNQIMSINTLFQLLVLQQDAASGKDNSYNKAERLLMMPDLINYMLTGEQRTEITIASTTQLFDLNAKKFSDKILSTYDIKPSLFAPVILPTEIVGSLKNSRIPELRHLDIPVVACASHDTAGAVLMTEAYTDRRTAFLSCGTWSLIGGLSDAPVITDEAFSQSLTNETGFRGSNMFFKNITGLYILEMYKKQLEEERKADIDFAEITQYVSSSDVSDLVDVDDPVFAQNEFNVKEAIDSLLGHSQKNDFDYFRVIYLSLADKYAKTLKSVEQNLGYSFRKVHMIGGGTQSSFLCALVADVTGLEVVAGPMEATAYGNLLSQMLAVGTCSTLAEGRQLILDSSEFRIYKPKA